MYVLVLLHYTGCNNLAKELGMSIGAVRLYGDLEYLHKLLFEIRAQVFHLHCLCHYLSATDSTNLPRACSATIHLKHVVYYYCRNYLYYFWCGLCCREKRTLYLIFSRINYTYQRVGWPQRVARENSLATKKWILTRCTRSASLWVQLHWACQRHAQYCIVWIINVQPVPNGLQGLVLMWNRLS